MARAASVSIARCRGAPSRGIRQTTSFPAT